MKILRDIVAILLIYAVYAVITIFVYGGPETFSLESFHSDKPPVWPASMLAVSLAMMLLWYVLGEWVIRPNASAATWYAAWSAGLLVILIAATVATFVEVADDASPWLHFLGGIGTYYLASVLFSPEFAKYRIWPARLIRRW